MNVHDSSGRAMQRRVKSSPDRQSGETNEEVFFSSYFFIIFFILTPSHTPAHPRASIMDR